MERETARRIVDRLQGEVGDRMAIEPYFWEHEVMVATKDYQENIPEMDGFDIVVCVLWSRLGTPLHPNRHPRPGGGYFESGTEYEFFTAMQAHNLRGTPDIFVFRNNTEPRRPSRPKEAREAVDREVDRLDHFFEKYFQEEKYFTSAINVYSTLGEFEDKLMLALHSFIEGRFPQISAKSKGKARYEGLPYLGLSAFDFNDAPVFFGRTAQIGEVVEAFQIQELEAQANGGQGKHFVLILGSSGSGKSSLARAGVLPMLVQPGVVEGAQVWRRAIFKPGDAGGDPFAAFAAALAAPEALPELASAGTTSAEIASMLKTTGSGAQILLRQAFAQAATQAKAEEEHRLEESIRQFEAGAREEDARILREKLANLTPPRVRLAVLADQLEELFTSGISEETISSFIEKLSELSNSGLVFVLGTLRSDFYPDCLKHPKLVELMRDRGTYALPAPTAGDIGQMIRQPASAAGLAFEENRSTGENLDELLRDAAIRDPAALPLLSYTLEQLYERRTPEGLLTLAAYHDLGGLEGAIGRRAESVFSGLPAEAQGAFDDVWRQLVTLSEGSQPVRRRTLYGALTASSGAPQLVDALVAARLLTVDQPAEGERTVSVAHEALLRQWPRVVEWVGDNLVFLRARSRMAARLAEWHEQQSSDDYLIPAGPPLAEAEGILSRHAGSLDAREIEYVRRSSAKARHREQARLRRARLVATGALVLSALAVAGGTFAFIQSKAADRERVAALKQKGIAEERKTVADQATRSALASQTRAAYLLGIENLTNGKTREGLASLTHALAIDPSHGGASDRLYSYHLYGLPKAIPILSATGPAGVRQRISGAARGPVQRILYLTPKGTPEVFDLNTRKVVPGGWTTEPDSYASVIMEDGARVINVRQDHTARFWEVKDTTPAPPSAVHQVPKDFTFLSSTLDGRHFMHSRADGILHLYRIADGKEDGSWKQKGNRLSFTEKADGRMISASGEDLIVYDRDEKKIIKERTDADYLILDVKNAAEADIAIIIREKRPVEGEPRSGDIQFINATTLETIPNSRDYQWTYYPPDCRINRWGTKMALATNQHSVRILHQTDPQLDQSFELPTNPVLVRLSPDDRLLISTTPDGTVRIFDTITRKLAFEPISHDGVIQDDINISWDGRYLLTATGDKARVWDLSVGPALSLPIVVTDGIRASASGPGERYWTGSAKGIRQWDLRDLKQTGPLLHPDPAVHDCLLDSAGVHAALLFDSKNVRFVRTDNPDTASFPVWTAPGDVDHWGLSADGSRFYAASGGSLHFIDTATAKPIGQPWKLPGQFGNAVFLQRIGAFAAIINQDTSGIYSGTLRLWSPEKSAEIPFTLPPANVGGFINSPDGRWLLVSGVGASAVAESFCLLWDLDDLAKAPRKIFHPGNVSSMDFSDDGRLFAMGGTDQTVKIWSTADDLPQAKAIEDPWGSIDRVKFSPDSGRLATIAVRDGQSSIRVWDWKEGCSVTQPLDFPVIAEGVAFTDNGRKIVITRPPKGTTVERYLQVIEVRPPPDLHIDFNALTQGAIALHVPANGIPTSCDPFDEWNKARASAPDSWFFQAPASRPISPAISAESLRWILEEKSVTIDELSAAMPAVGLSRAAIAYWYQLNYNRRSAALAKLDVKSEAYEKEEKELADLSERILTLAEFATRNSAGDAAVCYYLSMWALNAGEDEQSLDFIRQALAISPDDPLYLDQAGSVYRKADDNGKELESLEHLLKLKPDDKLNRIRLGYNLWRTGVRARAREEFKAVIDWPSISLYDKAPILGYLGRKQEALDAYKALAEKTKEASPDKAYSIDGLVYLILGYFQAGENDKAVEWYQELLKLAPQATSPDIIDGSSAEDETKVVLKKVLALTLSKHPELAPKAEGQ